VLDVLVDNAGRGLLWIWALGSWGLPVVLLEMGVFAFTHKASAAPWGAPACPACRVALPWLAWGS
jgi:hypothetical protein